MYLTSADLIAYTKVSAMDFVKAFLGDDMEYNFIKTYKLARSKVKGKNTRKKIYMRTSIWENKVTYMLPSEFVGEDIPHDVNLCFWVDEYDRTVRCGLGMWTEVRDQLDQRVVTLFDSCEDGEVSIETVLSAVRSVYANPTIQAEKKISSLINSPEKN